MEKKQKKERTLKDFVDILLPKFWIILLISAVCAMALFTVSHTKTDTYTSSAEFLVSCDSSEPIVKYYEQVIAETTINTYKNIVSGDMFCENVVLRVNADPQCNTQITKSQFRSMFRFTSGDAQTFSFSITHVDRNKAFAIANIVKECLLEEIEVFSEGGTLQTVRTLSEPQLSKTPNSKNSARNAIIAFFVGAVISSGVILVLAISDVTIRDKKKIEDHFNIPVLGVIPYHDINATSKETYGGRNKDVV